MATDAPESVSAQPNSLDERLDAIDRLLIGLLPRGERLEFVSRLESRLRERVAAGDPAVDLELQTPIASLAANEGGVGRGTKKRSRLALSAGILGLISLALLLALPFVYIAASIGMGVVGEWLLILLVGTVHVTMFVAGTLAVAFGIAALVKVARHSRRLFGRGWAITGLCTGPLPVMAGALPLLLMALQLVGSSAVSVSVSPTPVYGASACTTCGPGSPYSPPTAYPALPYGSPAVCPPPPTRPVETACVAPYLTFPAPAAGAGSPYPPPLATPPSATIPAKQLPLAEGPSTLPHLNESPEPSADAEPAVPAAAAPNSDASAEYATGCDEDPDNETAE